MWYSIGKSIHGTYWYVRVRAPDGFEDMVDKIYTLAKAQATWDNLKAQGHTPLSERPMEVNDESL